MKLKNFDMTQEEKQLLLKDLCARLPYGVKVQYKDFDPIDLEIDQYTVNGNYLLSLCKPYLRKMSSMTEDEKKMLWEELDKDMDILDTNVEAPILSVYKGRCYRGNPVYHEIDFLNRNHFDWRGLIPMGLALEAPEGIYNTKK
jgi:hypothetical protein